MSADLDPLAVRSREELITFLLVAAKKDFSPDIERPVTAEGLLEAAAAWLEDAARSPQFRDLVAAELGERPTWRGVAVLFAAARVYE